MKLQIAPSFVHCLIFSIEFNMAEGDDWETLETLLSKWIPLIMLNIVVGCDIQLRYAFILMCENSISVYYMEVWGNCCSTLPTPPHSSFIVFSLSLSLSSTLSHLFRGVQCWSLTIFVLEIICHYNAVAHIGFVWYVRSRSTDQGLKKQWTEWRIRLSIFLFNNMLKVSCEQRSIRYMSEVIFLYSVNQCDTAWCTSNRVMHLLGATL